MSDGNDPHFIEGRWEDIVADIHRFDGKRVQVSVVEEPLSPDERKRRFDAWLEEVRANPIESDLPIPSKAERREILAQTLEEKTKRRESGK